MQILHKLTMDLANGWELPTIRAVQNDTNTRGLELTLLSNMEPWKVPTGVTAAVGYRKPDGTSGLYDTLPDGSPATTIAGSIVTAIFTQQVLTVAGTVNAVIVLCDENLNKLSSFPFQVKVAPNPAFNAKKSEDYYKYSTMEDVNAVISKLAEDIEALKNNSGQSSGEVDTAEIQQIVEDYLAANPPTVTETDPTVPAWAKQPTKPTYTASEVGALPVTYTPPNQTAQQVGADPAGTAASAVSQHNTDTTAHNDLRIALQGLSDRINAALDSDDTTLDQMSEVVAYIKSNKDLIDVITTSKVSVADIVNDLVTNVTDKPLSAAQGVALKQLIDDLQAMIPKGGSGISVTGATVGQTVRIAAVDDDGVPTAWEPVDLPSEGGGEWELLTKNAETGEAEPIVMDAETLRYNFPSLVDYKKLFILIKKTYAATTDLTGNVWFRYSYNVGFVFKPSYASSYVEIDASFPGMCALKYLTSNNLQRLSSYSGTYTNVASLESPYWDMPNADWAEYYANCNTTITIWGVRR